MWVINMMTTLFSQQAKLHQPFDNSDESELRCTPLPNHSSPDIWLDHELESPVKKVSVHGHLKRSSDVETGYKRPCRFLFNLHARLR